MKSVILTKYGAPEVLKVKEFKNPQPLDNEVRIKVHYAGINFAEIMSRMKLYPGGPKPGSVLGFEASGIIDKIGKNVNMKPTSISKINTFMQMLLIVIILLNLSEINIFHFVSNEIIIFLSYIVIFTTLTSFIVYINYWFKEYF